MKYISKRIKEVQKEESKEGSYVSKQTIYIAPKSTNESECITTPEQQS